MQYMILRLNPILEEKKKIYKKGETFLGREKKGNGDTDVSIDKTEIQIFY